MKPALVFAALLLVGAAIVSAYGVELMPVDQVKPGMRGYGLTVFRGADPDSFRVEVVDVLHNVTAPKGDLIIVSCSGKPLDETGVIAGMSGSPVYIDGRLIGALAYAWPFAKEPLAGVTPINEMLVAFDRGLQAGSPGGVGAVPGGGWSGLESFYSRLEKYLTRDFGPVGKDGAWPAEPLAGFTGGFISLAAGGGSGGEGSAHRLAPIPTPLVVSGMNSTAYNRLGEMTSLANCIPLRSGKSSLSRRETIHLRPGSALAVQLISGDMDVSGVGTVTYVDGDKLLAFGHPMFLAGTVDFPMATAYIDAVIPSVFVSSKLGSAVQTVGAIRQDRSTAIAGLLGAESRPISLQVDVDLGGGDAASFNYRLARSSLLTPSLVTLAVFWRWTTTSRSSWKISCRAAPTCRFQFQPRSPS